MSDKNNRNRMNLSLPDDALESIDALSDRLGIPRTTLVAGFLLVSLHRFDHALGMIPDEAHFDYGERLRGKSIDSILGLMETLFND